MNSINQLASTAGQSLHEGYYGAVWRWNGLTFPCTHDEILTNPPLMVGGYSPNTHVTVCLRRELFAPGERVPVKGDDCMLIPAEHAAEVALQVQSVVSSPGDVLVKFVCTAQAQAA